MADILFFLITSIGLGVVCAVPAIVAGRFLSAREIARKQAPWVDISFSVGAVFIWRLVFPQVPLWLFVIIYIVVSPYRIYREQLWAYFLEGKLPKEDR